MTEDEKFVESVGDGCCQAIFLAILLYTIVGALCFLVSDCVHHIF